MPDEGPCTGHGHCGVSDAVQSSIRAPYGDQAPSSEPSATLPGPPTWPAHPTPLEPVVAQPAPSDGGGDVPWDTIVIALAGTAVALGAAGTFVATRRRSRPLVAV
jgi:hypothetical protein